MKRAIAAIAIGAMLALAPATADAAPSRVRCEQIARAAADRVAKPGSAAWRKAYDAAYLACASRLADSPFRIVVTHSPYIGTPVNTGPWWQW